METQEVKVEEAVEETLEEFQKRVDEHSKEMRALIVSAKRFFQNEKQETFEDQRRALKLSQDYAQVAYMWLRRGASNQKGF